MIVTGPIRVSKISANVHIVRTAWSDTLDLRQRVLLGNSITYNVAGATAISPDLADLIPVATTDADVYTASATTAPHANHSDDYCPLQINSAYMGAAHGLPWGVKITATGHGKTAVDVGSEWLNTTGHKWYIVRILDANNLLMFSENTGTGDLWAYRTWVASATLTHSANATNTEDITVGSATTVQYLWPAYKCVTRQCIIDGSTIIHNTGHYACETVDFVENYTIYDPSAVMAYLVANVGSNPAPDWTSDAATIAVQATISNTYRYHRNGSCTLFWRLTANKAQTVNNYGVVQAGALATPASGSVYNYIPGAAPFTIGSNNYDLAAGQTIASILDVVSLTPARWASASMCPNRFVAVRQAQDGSRDYGYAIGYAPLANGTHAIRKARVSTAMRYGDPSTKKMYPVFQGGTSTDFPTGGNVTGGYETTAVAFRVPFVPGAAGEPTYAAHYWVGSDVYLMVEAHADFAGNVALPSYLQGMTVTLVESQGTIAATGTRITAAGLGLSVTGYGSAVYRLSGTTDVGGVEATQLATDVAAVEAAAANIRKTDVVTGDPVTVLGVAGTFDDTADDAAVTDTATAAERARQMTRIGISI